MNWFDDCFNIGDLNTKYKNLVKKYHPDVSKEENALEIMKEINNQYDELYSSIINGKFNFTSIINSYKENRMKPIKYILAFFIKDKERGSGYFAYILENRNLIFNSIFSREYKVKIITDDSDTWKEFKGGFAVVSIEYDVDCDIYKAKNSGIKPMTPDYIDMYYWIHEDNLNSRHTESLQKSNVEMKQASNLYDWNKYSLIKTKFYETWIKEDYSYYSYYNKRINKIAFMRVGNIIMSCLYPIDEKYYTVEDVVSGTEFSYNIFQDCTKKEFCETHDVDYIPKFSDSLNCVYIKNENDLYWIDDPVVLHYARLGIVKFYQSKINFKLRYGSFDSEVLEDNAHELDIESAEIIQDFLDELNSEFEESIKSMIKKGKLKINII